MMAEAPDSDLGGRASAPAPGAAEQRSVMAQRRARPRRWHAWPERIALLIITAILTLQILIPPFIGLADNGDFARVLDPLGLQHAASEWSERYFGWVDTHYVPGPRQPVQLVSSQILLGKAAQTLGSLLARDGSLDIRVQGAVHLAVYLIALWLVLRAAPAFGAPARVAIVLAMVLAATDVAWVAVFNSFYGEAGTLVFLALLVGCGLHAARADPWFGEALAGYFVAAALFVAAKPQNYLLAVPLACFPLALLPRVRRQRARAAVVALALGLAALGPWMHAQLPWSLRVRNLWNNVFFTILPASPDPQADLAAFGLEPELAQYAGTSAFMPDIPLAETTARYGFRDVLEFYARRPARLWNAAADCASQAFVWRDDRIGNHPRSSGRPAGALARDFTGWSTFEGRMMPRSLPFLLAFLGAVVLVSGIERLRAGPQTGGGGTAALTGVLALCALLQLGVCVVGDGLYDAVKHLYLFQLLFDACLVAAVAWAATRASRFLGRL